MDERDNQWLNEAAAMGILRRLPVQDRSQGKILRIIDAAEALLPQEGYERMIQTPALLLERAEVTGGSFYTYFESSQAVIEALSLRQVRRVRAIIDQVCERNYASWEELSDVIVDAYASLFWSDPAVRELWLNGHLSPRAQAADREGDRYVAGRMCDMLMRFYDREGPSSITELHGLVLIVLHDHGLRLAFRNDERGDPETIAQIKLASRSYIGTFLPPTRPIR